MESSLAVEWRPLAISWKMSGMISSGAQQSCQAAKFHQVAHHRKCCQP